MISGSPFQPKDLSGRDMDGGKNLLGRVFSVLILKLEIKGISRVIPGGIPFPLIHGINLGEGKRTVDKLFAQIALNVGDIGHHNRFTGVRDMKGMKVEPLIPSGNIGGLETQGPPAATIGKLFQLAHTQPLSFIPLEGVIR